MIVHEFGAGHRAAVAVLNSCSFGAAAFIGVSLARDILGLFAFVTLGPRLYGPLEAVLHAQVGWFGAAVATSLVAGALVLIAATNRGKRVAWSYITALSPLPALIFIGVTATSYRLLGALLFAGTGAAYVRYLQQRKGLRSFVLLCVAALVISLVPVDITFRDVPGGVRFVSAGSGLLSDEGFEMLARGDLVVLGGCTPSYHEPRWVLVW